MLSKVHEWSAVAVLALAAACSSGSTAPVVDDDEATADDDTNDDDEATPKRDAGKTPAKDGGSAKPDSSTGKVDAGGNDDKGGEIPCEVDRVLQTHCSSCHGSTPKFGAPTSLTTVKAFQGAAYTDDAKAMHEIALKRVSATDNKRMPPVSNKALSTADLKTLTDWLKAGAKSGDACGEGEPKPTGDASVPVATPGSGGAHSTKLEYDDPNLKCYPLTAFSATDRKAPYSVPTNPDYYVAFNIKAPWTGTQYVRSFRSIIDNDEVLHHWLLFKQSSGGAEGVQGNALGAHPDGQMLYGWAPGGDDLYFDPDVAMAVESNVLYQLELHYNNRTGGPKPDASGVELCVTPTKPTHVAGLSWVGTDAIAGTTAVGRCAPSPSEPIHLIVAQPHMHTKGRNMKVEVTRKGGKKEVIHDEPFDFNNQRSYIFDNLLINSGDVMNTTCTYSEPATFGKATSDEMCYFFSIHWPAGALSSLGVGSVIHGVNSCMDI